MIAILALLACGTERWDMKTLTDKEAIKINYTAQPTTIEALNTWKAPPKWRTHRYPAELQVWEVTGVLKLVKTETDGDYHVVLTSDSTNASIIIEFPSSTCGKKLAAAQGIDLTQERADIKNAAIGSYVTVTGPAFFDFPHKQTGHSSSYIELHPVLTVDVDQ